MMMAWSSMPALLWLLAGAALLVAVAAMLLLQEAGTHDLEQRVASLSHDVRPSRQKQPALRNWIGSVLQQLGRAVHERTRLYSEQDLASLSGMISATGLNPSQFLPIALGAKVAVMVLIPLAALAYGLLAGLNAPYVVLLVVGGLAIGILAPEWILRGLRGPYQRDLQRGSSDALDLLVVCVESGMALEPALETVARELRGTNRAISVALATLVDELNVLPDRRQAFLNFGQRSGVDGLRRMAAIIAQSLQYGTPLGQALRAVSAELRRDRLTRLEAKAVRLPALLIFPLMVFILPTLFVALLGPGMLHMGDTLAHIGIHK